MVQSQTLTGQTISRLRAVLGVPVNVQESNCLKPNKVINKSFDMLHLSEGNQSLALCTITNILIKLIWIILNLHILRKAGFQYLHGHFPIPSSRTSFLLDRVLTRVYRTYLYLFFGSMSCRKINPIDFWLYQIIFWNSPTTFTNPPGPAVTTSFKHFICLLQGSKIFDFNQLNVLHEWWNYSKS